VGLDWKLTPEILLYANVAKGFKSGGYSSLPAVFASQLTPVTQESVLDYEAGMKAELLDNRMQLNLAAFYYDYQDKQLQGYENIPPFGPLPRLVNIPESTVTGAEFDLVARPADNLHLQLFGTWLETEVKQDPVNPTAPIGGAPTSFIGESFPYTPKLTFGVDIEQGFPLASGRELYVGVGAQYRDEQSGSFGRNASAQSAELYSIDSYTLVDVRAGIRFLEGKALVELWGRNVTDENYPLGVTSAIDVFVRYAGMPATYGARFSWKL
jgi:outer membrane receptor protein involved in Fe transport